MKVTSKPRHRTIDVDGLEIFYREACDSDASGDSSPPCVLLHGFPSSSHLFRHVMSPLAEVSRVVAPDLPGFGFSVSPGIDEYEYTFAHLAGTVEAFLERIGVDRFFVYLHDFGAPSATTSLRGTRNGSSGSSSTTATRTTTDWAPSGTALARSGPTRPRRTGPACPNGSATRASATST